jgi:hypothetical protein
MRTFQTGSSVPCFFTGCWRFNSTFSASVSKWKQDAWAGLQQLKERQPSVMSLTNIQQYLFVFPLATPFRLLFCTIRIAKTFWHSGACNWWNYAWNCGLALALIQTKTRCVVLNGRPLWQPDVYRGASGPVCVICSMRLRPPVCTWTITTWLPMRWPSGPYISSGHAWRLLCLDNHNLSDSWPHRT